MVTKYLPRPSQAFSFSCISCSSQVYDEFLVLVPFVYLSYILLYLVVCNLSGNFLSFSLYVVCFSRAEWLWGWTFLSQSVICPFCVLCPCVFCPCVPSVAAAEAAREGIWMFASSTFGQQPPPHHSNPKNHRPVNRTIQKIQIQSNKK